MAALSGIATFIADFVKGASSRLETLSEAGFQEIAKEMGPVFSKVVLDMEYDPTGRMILLAFIHTHIALMYAPWC